MSESINTHRGEDPVKEGLISLIKETKDLDGTIGSIKELPKRLLDIVKRLESEGVDFSTVDIDTEGNPTQKSLLENLIDVFNKAYPQEKIHLPINPTTSVVGEILNNLKALAWEQWLKNTGKALGRKENDIEIKGDIVTVKIPGYKSLEFNTDDYIIGGQKWRDNTNKFSREDFEKLIEFAGGDNSISSFWRAGKSAVPFFSDVLGLKVGSLCWSSSAHKNSDNHAWGLYLSGIEVCVLISNQDNRKSAFIS